eukprot:TRINITY_DN27154_c0_g3_i2.p1 TRINITY_DN27154_c0_g3~~TRINITY_DN27154_c0_g3_i2.p1  ORF type:complete len:499 (+),score=66.30 TRINITY_DN27154_c0_g3_i2:98-1594(+)
MSDGSPCPGLQGLIRHWASSLLFALFVSTRRSAAVISTEKPGRAIPFKPGNGICEGEEWGLLFKGLDEAYRLTDYTVDVNDDVAQLLQNPGMQWYKDNYQDCVEGFISMVLYTSFGQPEERRHQIMGLASEVARELNPLALKHSLSAWPFFGLLAELHLVWQSGKKAAPLATEPWHRSACSLQQRAPGVVSSMLSAMSGHKKLGGLTLLRRLGRRPFIVDVGVFDGTDWSMECVSAGAVVLGFEPSIKNRRLFEERFPDTLQARLAEAVPPAGCRDYTMIRMEPGEQMPRLPWADLYPYKSQSCAESHGHAYIIAAAAGERAKALNVTTRYDYTSMADQGYMKGPPDMATEEVAMVTLDSIFGSYLAPSGMVPAAWIDILKIDAEGYEMGALRGAERLLAEGRVRYLVLEFHPGMLGTTGTDPKGMLDFLRHYCFLCHSLKIDRPHSFDEFVERYTSDPEALPMQGLGMLEDLICENLAWRPSAPFSAAKRLEDRREL